MAEWLIAPVLKTGVPQGIGGSNPSPSAISAPASAACAQRNHLLPRSSAMILATSRPLLNIPPNIGPMRKPPCTLFAAMPEA